jgi:hypothetical protein
MPYGYTDASAGATEAVRWWTLAGALLALSAAVLVDFFLRSDPVHNDFECFDDLLP